MPDMCLTSMSQRWLYLEEMKSYREWREKRKWHHLREAVPISVPMQRMRGCWLSVSSSSQRHLHEGREIACRGNGWAFTLLSAVAFLSLLILISLSENRERGGLWAHRGCLYSMERGGLCSCSWQPLCTSGREGLSICSSTILSWRIRGSLMRNLLYILTWSVLPSERLCLSAWKAMGSFSLMRGWEATYSLSISLYSKRNREKIYNSTSLQLQKASYLESRIWAAGTWNNRNEKMAQAAEGIKKEEKIHALVWLKNSEIFS